MANNNEFADLENYRKCLLATHFYKTGTILSSGNPTDRFFGYIGPNGTTLAKVGSEAATTKPSNILVEGSFVHPVGLLAKQALSRDLANGDIKYGQDGVTFYHVNVSNTANTSLTFTQPGTVVGIFAKTTNGCAGDETVAIAIAGNAQVVASQTVTAATATSNKAKEITLTATWGHRTFAAGATTSIGFSNNAANDDATFVIAVAHHSL